MSAVIAGYARTPFVRFAGLFATLRAVELGGHAIAAALQRANVPASDVDRVYMGQVLLAGTGQNPARQAASLGGIPLTVPSITLNAVCLSGAEAVAAAAALISSGRADVVIAGGQESMSLAPHAFFGRVGTKYGAIEMIDTLEHDGLTDAFENRSMGASTETGNQELSLGRIEQDAFAAASHRRAAESVAFLRGEIKPFVTGGRHPVKVEADDGVRSDTTEGTLADLRPAFVPNGTITAGNSSQISDGAAALVLVSERYAEDHDLTGLATVEATALVAGPDVRLHAQPANAIAAALAMIGETPASLQAVEINEAFASVGIVSTRKLDLDPVIVNRHGGAIALGHPIGASGARIVGTLARDLQSSFGSGSLGAIGICGGGGQGTAVILRAV